MGLAAFNRMRRVEAMKAENVIKEQAKEAKIAKEKEVIEEAKTEEFVEVETNDELSVKEEPVRRNRRN